MIFSWKVQFKKVIVIYIVNVVELCSKEIFHFLDVTISGEMESQHFNEKNSFQQNCHKLGIFILADSKHAAITLLKISLMVFYFSNK